MGNGGFVKGFYEYKTILPIKDSRGAVTHFVAIGADITKRVLAEEALRKSEEKFTKAFHSSPDAITIASLETGFVLDVNEGFTRLSGFSLEEVKGKTLLELGIWPSLEVREKMLATLAEKGRIRNYETTLTNKSGELRNALVSAEVIELEGERCLLAITRDITERVKTEAALKVSEAQLREFHENAAEGIFRTTLDGNILYANQAMAEILGYEQADDLLGVDTSGLFIDLEERARLHTLYTENDTLRNVEFRLRKRNGEVIWIRENSRIVRDESGAIQFVEGFNTDITERKRATAALREREHDLAMAQEIAHIGSWNWDIATGELKWSDESFRILGFEPQAFTPTYEIFQKTVHPDDRDRVVAAVQAALEGADYDIEFRVVWPTENVWIVHAQAEVFFDLEGKVIRLVGTNHDITERKYLETESLRAEKLDSLGTLAAGLAHDFNNFLMAITLNITGARLLSKENKDLRNLLQDAENSVLRAKGITQQLSSLTKVEEFKKHTLPLQPLLEESVRFALQGQGVQPVFQIDPDIRPVDMDPGQINQVIHNLMINAVQAMNGDGTITVRATNRAVTAANPAGPLKPGDYVRVVVEDNGPGIAPYILQKIFDPYYTTKETGSGLGLFSCFRILKNHAGWIRVESAVGKGSSFIFYLPAVAADATQLKLAKQEQAERKTILIVDSDQKTRNGLSTILLTLGHEVHTATSGTGAIKYFSKCHEQGHTCDLVIVSRELKGKLSGIDMFQRMRTINPDVEGILISTQDKPCEERVTSEYGFRGCMRMPFGLEEIKSVLAN